MKPNRSLHPPPKKSGRTLSQRRWRRRSAAGRAVAPLEYDSDTIDYLVAHIWLAPIGRDDKQAIGDAASRMVRDAVRAWLASEK